MAAESKLRTKLKKRVEAYGGTIRAVSWLGRRNAPDVLALFPFNCPHPIGWGEEAGESMHHPWIETKGVEPSAREAQLREHERMRAAGCIVLVILTEAELDKWLPPLDPEYDQDEIDAEEEHESRK